MLPKKKEKKKRPKVINMKTWKNNNNKTSFKNMQEEESVNTSNLLRQTSRFLNQISCPPWHLLLLFGFWLYLGCDLISNSSWFPQNKLPLYKNLHKSMANQNFNVPRSIQIFSRSLNTWRSLDNFVQFLFLTFYFRSFRSTVILLLQCMSLGGGHVLSVFHPN